MRKNSKVNHPQFPVDADFKQDIADAIRKDGSGSLLDHADRVITNYVELEHKAIADALKHYGITADGEPTSDANALSELVICMGQDLFPRVGRPGAKRKWTEEKKGQLLAEVRTLIRPGSKSANQSNAFNKLANKTKWIEFLPKSGTAKERAQVLKRKFHDVKNEFDKPNALLRLMERYPANSPIGLRRGLFGEPLLGDTKGGLLGSSGKSTTVKKSK